MEGSARVMERVKKFLQVLGKPGIGKKFPYHKKRAAVK